MRKFYREQISEIKQVVFENWDIKLIYPYYFGLSFLKEGYVLDFFASDAQYYWLI